MKNSNKGVLYFLKTGVILLFIAAVMASMIALVNSLTKDRISSNELKAILEIVEKEFGNGSKLNETEVGAGADVDTVFEVLDPDGKKLGYCVRTSPEGFKDEIKVIVLTDNYGKCLRVEITSISDTPGVGTKVRNEEFLSAFAGKDGNGAAECDTIVGATVSSSAVKRAVVDALSLGFYDYVSPEDLPSDTADEEKDTEPEDVTIDPSTLETDPETTPETEIAETDLSGETRPLTYIVVLGEVTVTMRETTATETPGESTTGPLESTPETTGGETAEPVDPSTDETQDTSVPPGETDESTGPEDTGEPQSGDTVTAESEVRSESGEEGRQ